MGSEKTQDRKEFHENVSWSPALKLACRKSTIDRGGRQEAPPLTEEALAVKADERKRNHFLS